MCTVPIACMLKSTNVVLRIHKLLPAYIKNTYFVAYGCIELHLNETLPPISCQGSVLVFDLRVTPGATGTTWELVGLLILLPTLPPHTSTTIYKEAMC